MWPESAFVKIANLVKKNLLQFRYIEFLGDCFLLMHRPKSSSPLVV